MFRVRCPIGSRFSQPGIEQVKLEKIPIEVRARLIRVQDNLKSLCVRATRQELVMVSGNPYAH